MLKRFACITKEEASLKDLGAQKDGRHQRLVASDDSGQQHRVLSQGSSFYESPVMMRGELALRDGRERLHWDSTMDNGTGFSLRVLRSICFILLRFCCFLKYSKQREKPMVLYIRPSSVDVVGQRKEMKILKKKKNNNQQSADLNSRLGG